MKTPLNKYSFHVESVYDADNDVSSLFSDDDWSLIKEMIESETEEKTVREEGYTRYFKVTEQEEGCYFIVIDDVDDRDDELYHALPEDWDDEDAIWNLVKDRTDVTREEFFSIVDYHEYTCCFPWEFLCSFEFLYESMNE